jgi:hypothetical protein
MSGCLPLLGLISLVLDPSPASANEQATTKIVQCALEHNKKVAFRLQNTRKDAIATVLRFTFLGRDGRRLADEVIYAVGTDAPILGVNSLFSPEEVTAVKCSIDGYVDPLDQRGMVGSGSDVRGRRPCQERDGLNVDGGPDAEVAIALFGSSWILVKLNLEINHFFPGEASVFNGDVFTASIDGGVYQKVVVSGLEPQSVSFLYTDLKPGFHQINYGPWAVVDAVRQGSPGYSSGYHNFCLGI